MLLNGDYDVTVTNVVCKSDGSSHYAEVTLRAVSPTGTIIEIEAIDHVNDLLWLNEKYTVNCEDGELQFTAYDREQDYGPGFIDELNAFTTLAPHKTR